MKSYYQNPSATAKAMKGGWFHSEISPRFEGHYYVVDRKKDMLISGEKIFIRLRPRRGACTSTPTYLKLPSSVCLIQNGVRGAFPLF
jgi:long-subunit acyl-CoA synthetase (AMP-forming)